MLELEKRLITIAGEEANAYHSQKYDFEWEKGELERKLMTVNVILDEMNAAPGRVATYKPRFHLMDYQCPKCWVREEREAHIKQDEATREYKCEDCHASYTLPPG